jgi:hypothetical protein
MLDRGRPVIQETQPNSCLGYETLVEVLERFTICRQLPGQRLTNYQNLAKLLIAPDRIAFRTSSIVVRPPGAIPPHSNRVAAGVQ